MHQVEATQPRALPASSGCIISGHRDRYTVSRIYESGHEYGCSVWDADAEAFVAHCYAATPMAAQHKAIMAALEIGAEVRRAGR